MQLTPTTVLIVISASVSVATAIFWGSFYLGRIWNEIRRAHERLDEHDEAIGELRGRRRTDPHWEAR